MKKCTNCGTLKPISEFYKNKDGKYGVGSWCKECAKEHNKKYRENNKEDIKERDKKWRENNKEHIKERSKKYNKNNYISIWVTQTLQNHRKKGIMNSTTFKEDLLKKALEKPPCSICHKELEWYSTGTGKLTDLSPSLDRINNDTYMYINNIDIICHKCNAKKRSETLEENLAWCKQFEEYANNILRK